MVGYSINCKDSKVILFLARVPPPTPALPLLLLPPLVPAVFSAVVPVLLLPVGLPGLPLPALLPVPPPVVSPFSRPLVSGLVVTLRPGSITSL